MLTLKNLNTKVRNKWGDVEVIKGDGYFWLCGDDVPNVPSTTILAHRVNQLTLDQWLLYIEEIMNNKRKY